MSSGSPTAYLLWAILAVLFQTALIVHLWSYDKFKCICWDSGRQPGAFKRVMTYSYLATMPLLVVFAVAMTVFKFQEGFILLPPHGNIVARPFEMWQTHHRHWVLPLLFMFSMSWAFEQVTHLEELTFWLFLLRQGPSRREWFSSGEFRLWSTGSVVAVIGMPLVTLITRGNLETCEAWILFAGATASTIITIIFLYVLWKFPSFLRYVKMEGAEPDVVIRLSTFYQLNRIRVVFRFLFTLPLLLLAIDGIQGQHPLSNNFFGSDFLLMIGAIGCIVSTAITLLIFFPRSLAKEDEPKTPLPSIAATSPKAVEALGPRAVEMPTSTSPVLSQSTTGSYFPFPNAAPYFPGSEIMLDAQRSIYQSRMSMHERDIGKDHDVEPEPQELIGHLGEVTSPPPSYHRHPKVVLSNSVPPPRRAAQDSRYQYPPSNLHLHPYVMSFRSPIDLPDVPDDGCPRAV